MTPDERKYINQNFLIRITTTEKKTLVGAGQLYRYLEQKFILKIVDDLKTSFEYKYTYKYRRGLKIEIVSK